MLESTQWTPENPDQPDLSMHHTDNTESLGEMRDEADDEADLQALLDGTSHLLRDQLPVLMPFQHYQAPSHLTKSPSRSPFPTHFLLLPILSSHSPARLRHFSIPLTAIRPQPAPHQDYE